MLENFKKQIATRRSIFTEILAVTGELITNNVVKHFKTLKPTVLQLNVKPHVMSDAACITSLEDKGQNWRTDPARGRRIRRVLLVVAIVAPAALALTFTGTIDSSDPTQTGRLVRNGVAATCASPKANPGLFTATGARHYDQYDFVNASGSTQCVIVDYRATVNPCNVFAPAYDGSFNPASPTDDYLADSGGSTGAVGFPIQTYSFEVQSGAGFVIVAHEVDPNAGCAGYQINVNGTGIVEGIGVDIVDIDVKPGTDPNLINLKSKGVIPVAILSTPDFDATTVDPSTVCFGDAEDASQRDCTEKHGKGHIEDVNGDGRLDLVLHYETQQTGIDPGDTKACLTGQTTGGTVIAGCDDIVTS